MAVFHVVLRPDSQDTLRGDFLGRTAQEARDAMERWIRQHGRPGDTYVWARSSYVPPDEELSGQGVVPSDDFQELGPAPRPMADDATGGWAGA